MTDIKVGDRVEVKSNKDEYAGRATVVNINDFRDPDTTYAIDADFYKDDFLFVSKSQLKKIEEEI